MNGCVVPVRGDLIKGIKVYNVKYVMQQITCLTTERHGLCATLFKKYRYSKTFRVQDSTYSISRNSRLFKKYPYSKSLRVSTLVPAPKNLASHITRGIPGEIDILCPPIQNDGPIFVNLMGECFFITQLMHIVLFIFHSAIRIWSTVCSKVHQ